MGIRETLNQNQKLTTWGTVGIIVLALVAIIWQLRPEGPPPVQTRSYYTYEDGTETEFFVDEIKKLPPFDHNGRQAVRAYVYQCGDSPPFVGWMERYTEAAKKKLEEHYANPSGSGISPEYIEYDDESKEIKKPKDKRWYPMRSPAAEKIMSVTCPDGSPAMPIYPEVK